MEAKNADLSALRINRSGGGDSAPTATDRRRRLVIGLVATGAVALVAVLLLIRGTLGSAVPVHLTPATMVSPIRSGGGGGHDRQRLCGCPAQGRRRV